MKETHFTNIKSQTFEKTMTSGLTIFAAVAILQLAGSGNLIGPLLFALCCLSIALPFLIFQLACTALGVPQRHKVLLQTATMIIALVGVFGLLISVSSLIGILFAISCICAYYLFTVFSAGAESCETSPQTEGTAESSSQDIHHFASQP